MSCKSYSLFVLLICLVLVSYIQTIWSVVMATVAPNQASQPSHTGLMKFAFSADGGILVSVEPGAGIELWNVLTGQKRLIVPVSLSKAIDGVALSPDGQSLAVVTVDTIALWDTKSNQERSALPVRAGVPTTAIAFSPDGKTLVTAGGDNVVAVWDTESGLLKRALSGHSDIVTSFAFSLDGKMLATAGRDARTKLWDVASGQERLTLSDPFKAPFTGVAFSPDGTLASTDETSTITLWRSDSAYPTRILSGHKDVVNGIAFSPDGTTLASGSEDRQIKLWAVASGQERLTLPNPSGVAVTAVVFSPDGKTLASISQAPQIVLWDLPAGNLRQVLLGPASFADVAFSLNQQALAGAGSDGQLMVWDLATGKPLTSAPNSTAVPGSNGSIGTSTSSGGTVQNTAATQASPLSVSAQGTGTPNGNTQTLSAASVNGDNMQVSSRPSAHAWKGVAALAISPDGTRLGVASGNNILLLDARTGTQSWGLQGQLGAAVTGVAFSADGKRLVSGGRDSVVRARDVTNKAQLQVLAGHEHCIRAVAVSADGKFYASVGEETRVFLWNAVTGKLDKILSGGHTSFVNSAAFSPDGKSLVTGGADARIVQWDVTTGKPLQTLLGHSSEVNSVVFSPDGSLLASAGADSSVRLWFVPTGHQMQVLAGHQAPVRTVAFSRDGQTLVSAGEDAKIIVWDVATLSLRKVLTGTTNLINALMFRPDGTLVVGDADNKIALWNVATGTKTQTITVSATVGQLPNDTLRTSVSITSPTPGSADLHRADRSTAPDSLPAALPSVHAASTNPGILAGLLNWLFPAANAAIPPPPGGPILVITSATAPYSQYYTEILRTEGLNTFAVMDITSVTSTTTLNAYDVVILAPTSLTTDQVTMFTTWVNGGGNLIAMRPDSQLAGLLGLTITGSTLSNGYLLVDNSTRAGNGTVNQPIQFHSIADRYTLNGASSIATLYTDATTATANPAVTLRSVGTNGGQAAAFTYDLATSIVYSRQGNPAWAAQERDGYTPIRSDDKFYGAATGDPQPDWVDLNHEVAVPQADEQQRLLANLILQMDLVKKPLPRFWYFPNSKVDSDGKPVVRKAVVIMTGDDHANGGTAGRFNQYLASSPSGCNVANWECIRSTSYIYVETQNLTPAQAASYTAQGFEVGLHLNTNCADYTLTSLRNFYSQQVSGFKSAYPTIPAPITQRHHCIAWSDWVTGAKVELENGMRLDTSYYFWPPGWVQNRPGFFTGSAMPMRFADLDGTLIDVYNVTTQMTDESGQDYPFTSDALLSAAIGPQGYYGAYTVNAHTDSASSSVSDGVVASALARDVPIVSSVQMLHWLDARNSSSFGALTWSNNALSFTITPGNGANGLQAMVPTHSTAGVLTGITTSSGGSVPFTIDTIKGIEYAFFSAAAGNYTATYAADPTPTVISISPATGATGVNQGTAVTATFNEAMNPTTITTSTFGLQNAGNTVPATVTYTAATHTATLTPSNSLAASTTYTATVKGGTTGVKDLAGNTLTADVSWSFTTGSGPTGAFSAWSSSTTPTNPSVADPNSVELGVKFKTDLDGFITGIRFYKGTSNTGTHVGTLWSSSGQQLATATFTNETGSGWQQISFATPVAITANTVYVASYHAPNGFSAGDNSYFANSGVDNGPIHLLSNAAGGGNGVYAYSASTTFPTSTYNATNYWVDVVFATSTGSDTTPPTVTATSPANGATGVNPGTPVTATFSEALDSMTVNTLTFELRDASNTLVPVTTVSYNATTLTATLTPSSPLAPATYTATVKGGTTDPRVKDPAGNALAANVTWSFTTAAGPTCPCSIWPATATPTVAADSDTLAIELGVKFQADVNGFITGIRFYKGTTNTGTHTGTLWSSSGQQLATATFTGETGSGWQQVTFATPVAITANTVYVASYHTNVGHYAGDTSYFASAGIDNPPLHALRNGVSGGNGVYLYGAGGFPTNTYQSSNYWVDVVFATSTGPDTTPPTVTATSPANGATGVNPGTPVTATFSEAIDPATISTSSGTFTLQDATHTVVPATVGYNATTHTATLTPNSPLVGAPATTYTATLKGGATDPRVKDLAGNALAANVTWSFTTAAGPTCPCSIWPATATPTVAADPDVGAVELGVKFQAEVNGYITGIRFYKGTTNTGTHIGSLWDSSGNLLAQATFTGEIGSGWQQVTFATRVAITANTVYVASYHTNVGHYAGDTSYFASAGIDNPPLHALRNGVSGGNGVYLYGAGGFPTNTYQSSNYWVDVVFTTTP